MNFPSRDLTNQYIKTSYQDVLQQYFSSSNLYILNGLGDVIFTIPSKSIGYNVITSDITSSMIVASASVSTVVELYKESSSFSSESISSSHALFSDTSYYSDISENSLSSSFSETSSFLNGSGIILKNLRFDTSSTELSDQEGCIFWDNENHTLAIKPDITESTLQVGQELWMRYVAGEDISNGDAIYITEGNYPDGHPICKKAISNNVDIARNVVAIATANALSGSHNLATINGVVNDIDTSEFPPGSTLFYQKLPLASFV